MNLPSETASSFHKTFPPAAPSSATTFAETTSRLVQPPLSGFVRDAIREKAARELAAIGASLDAFGRLLSVASALGSASSDLTALLGNLAAIAADSSTIGRAKKLRKLLDEARDAAETLVETTGIEARRVEAEEKRDMLLRELNQAGIALDADESA
jgi:hypothetical protein